MENLDKSVRSSSAIPTQQPWRVLSLFTGIGGMDMGFDGQVIVIKILLQRTVLI